MFFVFFVLFSFGAFSPLAAVQAVRDPHFSKVAYSLSDEPIDVVIPCSSKDVETLDLCIAGIQKNGKKLRRIIVVSKEPLTASAEWFDETLYPFTKTDMALEIFQGDAEKAEQFLSSPRTRIGWLYQQMLKYYAPFVIPGISSNVLVLDADVIFLNPVEFISPETNGPYFTPGRENMRVYFEHAARLIPHLHRVYSEYSGISHHMLFQRPILEDLFAWIDRHHQVECWKAFCRCIDHAELYNSPYSEYEIYFNFTLLRTDQAVVRPLLWLDVSNLRTMESLRRSGYAYIACHEWWRSFRKETLWGK